MRILSWNVNGLRACANKGFTEKAPAAVVQKEREKLSETEQALAKLQARHDLLKSLSD